MVYWRGVLAAPSTRTEPPSVLRARVGCGDHLFTSAPNDPPACPSYRGVNWSRAPVNSEPPSVLRVRADCGGRLRGETRVVVHNLARQLLNHLLAASYWLVSFPRCRLYASPLSQPQARAEKPPPHNQSLRLHRPQTPVSPTAVSESFLIRSLRPNRTGRIDVGRQCPALARYEPPSVLRVRADCGGRLRWRNSAS